MAKEIEHEVDVSEGIECGGFHWTILADEREHKRMESDGCNGFCNFHFHEISLSGTLGKDLESKTILHEFLEAIVHVYCDGKIEHTEIQRMSFGLHQVMESLRVRFVVKPHSGLEDKTGR